MEQSRKRQSHSSLTGGSSGVDSPGTTTVGIPTSTISTPISSLSNGASMPNNLSESLTISSTDFETLRGLLFTEDGHENFAVLFCGLSISASARRRLVREIWPAPASAYNERLPYHLE